MDQPGTSARSSNISTQENNISMLLDKLKELRMSANDDAEARVYGKVESLLRKEIDKVEMSQYFGLEYDSDQELKQDTDSEYDSADERDVRNSVTYDIDKMFEIIVKRDFNKWSMSTIHSKYRLIKDGDAGRKQLSRMRRYVRRESVSNRLTYQRLKKDVWNEVYSLLTEGVVLHDVDVQQIGMIKAEEKGLHDFKASDGWIYYFKNAYNIVDRHIDRVCVSTPSDKEEKLKQIMDTFKREQIPEIANYAPNKIWNADQVGLQLEMTSGRGLAIRGTKKVVRKSSISVTRMGTGPPPLEKHIYPSPSLSFSVSLSPFSFTLTHIHIIFSHAFF